MKLQQLLKSIVLRFLPASALLMLKKAHYAKALRTISEDSEVGLRVIKKLVNPGDTVMDIGANIGVFTKYLSAYVGSRGCVVSVEPILTTFEILRNNVRTLGLANVVLHQCAASDKEETVTMEIPSYASGGENFYEARISTSSHSRYRSFSVGTKTIDSLMKNHSLVVSFIKCDVEGHELPCLKGAVDVIRHSKPAWYIEITKNPSDPTTTAFLTFQYLREFGYRPFWYNGQSLRPWTKDKAGDNYFFLTDKHMALLKNNNVPIYME